LISGPDDIATRFDATVLSARTSLQDYLQSGWIDGLVDETVRVDTINGLESATANARSGGWRFKVRVIRNEEQVYRFITAAPQTNTNLEAVSRQITGSFKLLSDREIAALKPLKIRVIRVGNQSLAQLVAQMRGTGRPLQLFRLLNGLETGQVLESGQSVKIITDR